MSLGASARSFAPFLTQTPETQELPAEEANVAIFIFSFISYHVTHEDQKNIFPGKGNLKINLSAKTL